MTALQRLRELEAAATPGPWKGSEADWYTSNRDLANAARNHLSALLDIAEAAQAHLDAARFGQDAEANAQRALRDAIAALEAQEAT